MNWNTLLSPKRLGSKGTLGPVTNEDRTQFQRDYDRIIFSSPFRRMQNKTQVFPLPEHIFVHNRLTHSLEVASVGRSLGNLLSEYLLVIHQDNPLIHEIGTIVSTACLAHDLGNPPFGHSGEAAISNYFNKAGGQKFKDQLSEGEWKDFTCFDGNANAFRTLTHQFNGKREGGFALTYSTLASIVKYPYESVKATKPKFGFFQSDKENYYRIATELGIAQREDGSFARHPLVYLVEAADDICYQIMDLEDAFKLGILNYDRIRGLFQNFFAEERIERFEKTFTQVSDINEQISYLRANVIGELIYRCIDIFKDNYDAIMAGTFAGSLIDQLPEKQAAAMKEVQRISYSEIYAHRSVVEIEIAGYKIIGTLLEEFVDAIINTDKKDKYSQKILSLLPGQYTTDDDSVYLKIQSVVDFVSGMTDIFALDLYRKLKGISIPGVV
ncbi:deoxyguanosinetriphosphate triphosphohydrolase [Draconibacterium orientale]|uniref:deoxyguanosinetriphosphate triphosphohydrolase n=1 Tax=Draconibacterium orientale TaxID=1168034 RepID=UPI002ABDC0D7|nr:deoxyguanosinetriphosphate triphosphohydrolase [Draconibacterium orientale]